MPNLYDQDFYAWANQQAAFLQAGRLADADIANIAEEIESAGGGEKRELVSQLNILLLHLLKWRFAAERRGPSWALSIANTRDELTDHLEDNPSLKAMLPVAVDTAYRRARRSASIETGVPEMTFPPASPWTFQEAMDGKPRA